MAGEAGCRSNDYLVKINGVDVFNLSHDKAKQLIKSGGDRLELVIERWVRQTKKVRACGRLRTTNCHGSLPSNCEMMKECEALKAWKFGLHYAGYNIDSRVISSRNLSPIYR